jgi:hypothetical protein
LAVCVGATLVASARRFFFSCFVCLICWLFGTLCRCHPWGGSLKLSPLVLSVPLISSAPTIRFQSFLASHHDVLSTPPSTSVFGQHAIGFLPTVVILIVCFPCFSFGCFSDFACICLFFHCYFHVRFLLFVPFIWLFFRFCLYLLVFPLLFPYTFSFVCSFYLVVFPFLSFYFPVCFLFPVFACNKALSSQIIFCL